VTCNRITKPEFTKEQIAECGKCKHASARVKWCGLFGDWIGEQKIIVPSKKIQYPSMPTMGKNFAKEGIKHIAGGMKKRSDEEYKKCMAICDICEWFVKDKVRCQKCGCKMQVKARWVTAHCPINKW